MGFLRDKKVKTRKPHECFACLEIIPIGAEVDCQTCADDTIYSLYTCEECQSLLEKYPDNYFDDIDDTFEHGCIANFGYPDGYEKGDYYKEDQCQTLKN